MKWVPVNTALPATLYLQSPVAFGLAKLVSEFLREYGELRTNYLAEMAIDALFGFKRFRVMVALAVETLAHGQDATRTI
jgi:hypothetical protein